ncbi:hypothetical protein [Gluconobacter kondonii]|uniref:hypothetical protein n=1 Tax=Gluconobacter kondonii TaxID=941463 RepID=UPI001B8D6153|nr:hypothetical protein [Gluconobacter kondonii]MBS1054794.1 hypothetical protein [Gluconobacter kondonii]
MSEKTRIAALRAAVSIPAIRDDGLTEVLFCASALDEWLSSHPVVCSRSTQLCSVGRSGRCTLRRRNPRIFSCSINGLRSVINQVQVLLFVIKRILSKMFQNFPDQALTGHVFTHSSSSSVVADGESGDSVAADPRNDATPYTSLKGVRDDV